MIIVLALSFGSVILGYVVQRAVVPRGDGSDASQDRIASVAKWIKLVTLAGLLPWPILFTFWRLESVSPHFAVIPLLGLLSLAVGGTSALVLIRLMRLDPRKAGAFYACGMMTNLGVVGGLIGIMFFGPDGFLTVQLFTMFEVFTYYLVVFPLSQQIGAGGGGRFRFDPRLILSKPMSLIPISSIVLGLVLRGLGVPAPTFLDVLSRIIVPVITGTIGFSIGLTLRVSRLRRYRREAALIAAIKFLAIPAVVIPAAYALGLPGLLGGVAFKMVVFLSFGPVALIAMVPPQLYDLDLDLANSGWLVTTVGHLIIIPILILIVI